MKSKSVKTLAVSEKWEALFDAGLRIDLSIHGKKIALIDDKYQSGTTLQFVASRLFEAGADSVLGLVCVKTWRDTDNR